LVESGCLFVQNLTELDCPLLSLKHKRLFSGTVMQELTLVQRLTLKQAGIKKAEVGGETMVLNLILQM